MIKICFGVISFPEAAILLYSDGDVRCPIRWTKVKEALGTRLALMADKGKEQNSYFACALEFPACVYHASDRHSFPYDFFQLENSG